MCEVSSERVLAVERLRAGWLICASMAKDTGLPWDLQEDGPRLVSVNLVLYNPMRMTPYVEIWGGFNTLNMEGAICCGSRSQLPETHYRPETQCRPVNQVGALNRVH